MTRRAPDRRLGVLLALILGAPPLLAAAPARFEDLPPAPRGVLEPFRTEWSALPPERREALLRAAEIWLELDIEQRRIAARRLLIWESLSPEERQRLRAHLRGGSTPGRSRPLAELLSALAPGERQSLLAKLRALDPPERRRLRAFLAAQPPPERLAWVRRWLSDAEGLPHEAKTPAKTEGRRSLDPEEPSR